MILSLAWQKDLLLRTKRMILPRQFIHVFPLFYLSHHQCRAWILFIVQAGERNVFDQRWLEYELLEKYARLPPP